MSPREAKESSLKGYVVRDAATQGLATPSKSLPKLNRFWTLSDPPNYLAAIREITKMLKRVFHGNSFDIRKAK